MTKDEATSLHSLIKALLKAPDPFMANGSLQKDALLDAGDAVAALLEAMLAVEESERSEELIMSTADLMEVWAKRLETFFEGGKGLH